MSIQPLSQEISRDTEVINEQWEPPTFEVVYEAWFDEVRRWIRAMGGPEADRDDLVQEVFLVVHRRLPDFDGGNLPGWLYAITRRKVRDYRRLRWIKRMVFFEKGVPDELGGGSGGPLAELETREKRRLMLGLLEGLADAERRALVLFEIEQVSGQEIAALEGVPLNTIWTRLHKARHKLKRRLAALETKSGGGGVR